MSAASDILETEILLLLLNNTALAALGDAAGVLGSAVAGSVYVSLHTADPGEAGTQATNEATYVGYARVAVARAAGGWTVGGGAYANAAAVTFAACTAGVNTITHIGIGTAATLAGKLLLKGAFSNPPSLAVSAGIAPKFDAGVITGTVA